MLLLGGLASCGTAEPPLGPEAQLAAAPGVVQFSPTSPGQTALRLVTVSHIGTDGVVVLQPRLVTQSADLWIELIESERLAPGEVARVQIGYRDSDGRPDRGVLEIGHNLEGRGPVRIPIHGPEGPGLVPSETEVSFGSVATAGHAGRTLLLSNQLEEALRITGLEIHGDADHDFEVSLEHVVELAPDDSLTLDLAYWPQGFDDDAATLVVVTDRPDLATAVTLSGREDVPHVEVEPAFLSLGNATSWGKKATLHLHSSGPRPLTVQHLSWLTVLPSLTFELPEGAAVGQPLDPGESLELSISFVPTAPVPMLATPLGLLRVRTDDPLQPQIDVPIYGAAADTDLEVVPKDLKISAPPVASGGTFEHVITVRNTGPWVRTIHGVFVLDATSPTISIPDAPTAPVVLEPGGPPVELQLRITNPLTVPLEAHARILILTDDPGAPELTLDVHTDAVPEDEPLALSCWPRFEVGVVDFGTVAPGQTSANTAVWLRNDGLGDCEVTDWDLHSCDKVLSAGQTILDCGPEQESWYQMEQAVEDGTIIEPGEHVAFEVSFTAPLVTDLEGSLMASKLHGALTAWCVDSATRASVYAGTGELFHHNLIAGVLPVALMGPTGDTDLGSTPVGCESQPRTIRIENVGLTAADVSVVPGSACPADLRLVGDPPLPASLSPGQSVEMAVSHAPTAEGGFACDLEATFGSPGTSPVLLTGVMGRGLPAGPVEEVAVWAPPPEVDVLFVVEGSPNTDAVRAQLTEQLPSFDLSKSWDVAPRFGVVSPYLTLTGAALLGPSDWTDTLAGAAARIDGVLPQFTLYPDFTEAAWTAVAGSAAGETVLPCGASKTCTDATECTAGTCHGVNAGFTRPRTPLHIVLVGARSDTSAGGVARWVRRIAEAARGAGGSVVIHTVTGGPVCAGLGVDSLKEAVAMTEGTWTELCTPEEAGAKVFELLMAIFGPPDRLMPAAGVAPGSLDVSVERQLPVDGEQPAGCGEAGWHLNETTGAVVFDASCPPEVGDLVRLDYEALCGPEESEP